MNKKIKNLIFILTISGFMIFPGKLSGNNLNKIKNYLKNHSYNPYKVIKECLQDFQLDYRNNSKKIVSMIYTSPNGKEIFIMAYYYRNNKKVDLVEIYDGIRGKDKKFHAKNNPFAYFIDRNNDGVFKNNEIFIDFSEDNLNFNEIPKNILEVIIEKNFDIL